MFPRSPPSPKQPTTPTLARLKTRPRRFSRDRTRGFTRIELLVAIAILGLLIAIALSALASARASGTRTQCLANLRTTGQAITGYRGGHDDLLPWAIYDMDVRLQWLARMPALGPYLDVEIPCLDNRGEICTSAPWICPADDEDGLPDGVSSMCGAYDLTAMSLHDNPVRIVSLIFDTNPDLPLWLDEGMIHSEGPGSVQKVLLVNGAAMARSNIGR